MCTCEHRRTRGPSFSPSSPHLPSCTTLSLLDSSLPHRGVSGPLRWCPLAPLRWPRAGWLAVGLGTPHSLCIQLSYPQVVEGSEKARVPSCWWGSTSQRQQGPPSLLTLACAFVLRPGRTRGGESSLGPSKGLAGCAPAPGLPLFWPGSLSRCPQQGRGTSAWNVPCLSPDRTGMEEGWNPAEAQGALQGVCPTTPSSPDEARGQPRVGAPLPPALAKTHRSSGGVRAPCPGEMCDSTAHAHLEGEWLGPPPPRILDLLPA